MTKILNFFEKNSGKVLAGLIAGYILFFSGVCVWKYINFGYNALDLAIYNNALFNTINGHWFWSAIQGHNYWGDHFEPLLILFLPLYSLWQSPTLLLIIQTIFLGLTAWPLYKISQKVLTNKLAGLTISFLWLINPLVHNINLFEFHALAFFPFLFSWLFYYYLKLKDESNQKLIFCFFAFLISCLLVREDAAFIILTFLIIVLTEISTNKNKKILLITHYSLLVTLAYTFFAFQIINHFSPSHFSPFAYYYGWINNLGEIVGHLLTLANWEMILGLLLPFLFIPLLKPKWLWLCLMPVGQIIFSEAGGGALIWQTHYAALFLPALFIAFIYSWQKANDFCREKFKSSYLLILLLIITNVYLWFSLGPFKDGINRLAGRQKLKNIPVEQSVVASDKFLANFSSRENIYALKYYFLGVQQFGQANYSLAKNPDYILFNNEDVLALDLHLCHLKWAAKYCEEGYQRMSVLIKNYKIKEVGANFILLQNNYAEGMALYTISNNSLFERSLGEGQLTIDKKLGTLGKQISLEDYELRIVDYPPKGDLPRGDELQIALSLRTIEKIDKNYYLRIMWTDGKNEDKKNLPLAYFYPTSSWQTGEKITINYWLKLGDNFDKEKLQVNLSLMELSGGLEMGALGETELIIDQEKEIDKIELK
jgi:uncharacterized membrane protein